MSGAYIELLSYSPRASLSWSTWPPASAFSNHSSSTTTVSARQESGLRSTVNRCGLNDFTVNAPVPTAASSAVNVTGSSTSAHTCSATTRVCRYIPDRENDGCSNVSTTSVSDVASAPTVPGAERLAVAPGHAVAGGDPQLGRAGPLVAGRELRLLGAVVGVDHVELVV